MIRNYKTINLSTQHYYMRVHLQIDLQKICLIGWADAQESLGYGVVVGKAY